MLVLLNNFEVVGAGIFIELLNRSTPDTMRSNKSLPMTYCDNFTLSQVWERSGVTHCFLDTASSSIVMAVVVIFGIAQCVFYGKFGANILPKFRPKTRWYAVQYILTFVMALEGIVFVMIEDTVIRPRRLFGYEVYRGLASIVAWTFSIWLLYLERSRVVPTRTMRGHGPVLLSFWTIEFVIQNVAFVSWLSPDWWWAMETADDYAAFSLWCVRYVCTIVLFVLGLWAPGVLRPSHFQPLRDEEEGALSLTSGSTWSNAFKKIRTMLPYLWPKGNVVLQLDVVFCVLLLVMGRVINVYVPLYNKKIVDSLTVTEFFSPATALLFRWDLVLIWVVLKFLQGGGAGSTGLLNNVRSIAWIKVQQFTTRMIQLRLFTHLHELSLRWHLTKKTGEVLRIVDRGTNSINTLLSYVLFNVFPTIADIIIAVIYFITAFDYVFGIIVFICMVFYLFATFYITEWRTKHRRDMNTRDNETNFRAVDSLLNFETVKYYGASKFEIGRYDDAIQNYQKAEFISTMSLSLLNIIQNFVVTLGLLAGSMLAAWAVVHGFNGMILSVGDFVQFGTYLLQLYGPLNFLGTYYRMIQQAFIDMENMFDLLDQNQEVEDIPDAAVLRVTGGAIEFSHVNFHYLPEKPILRDVTFTVPPGHTYALVGNSGGGKSTIIRLLFRFYDIQSGVIRIDGQDISLVKQDSLRQAIGVVPQDTVLFNNNIRYNVRYGRVGASDSEVDDATRAADIHDRILSFPSGYDTMVGERGLKLSGGEKQRVAIARTMLKSPDIILLDEATSALDTHTERNIQASLYKICENRTTVIVAHRLSTIVHANCIIVLREGEIVERGTHEELLRINGLYTSLWVQQTTSEKQKELSANDAKED